MKTIGMILSAVAAFFAYGYGDLPNVFDATTGYVTVDFGAATEPPAVQWTVGLVTLDTTKAEALKPQMVLSNPAPFKNWRGTLDIVANGDGTSTIVVNYKTVGMTILFR